MKITKRRVAVHPLAYALCLCDSPRGERVFCAAQGPAGCISFSARDGSDVEMVFGEPGGTMTLLPLAGDRRLLATIGFYTGFKAEHSRIARVERMADGRYTLEPLVEIPYLHRFAGIDVHGEPWIVASSLCGTKASRDDWSSPGSVYCAPVAALDRGRPAEILAGIHRNHGMYCGPFEGLPQAVVVTGTEGAFVLSPPASRGGEWGIRRIFDFEISELVPFDIDGDGVDELITIEGFHGDRLVVYKKSVEGYEPIYSYPVAWGHSLWCGVIFGRRSILIGYNSANAALVLLAAKSASGCGGFSMEPTMIDELQAYNNIAVRNDGDVVRIFAACRSDNVMLYLLEP